MYSEILCFELCSLKLKSHVCLSCSHESPGLACCEYPEITVTARLFEHCVLAAMKTPTSPQLESLVEQCAH